MIITDQNKERYTRVGIFFDLKLNQISALKILDFYLLACLVIVGVFKLIEEDLYKLLLVQKRNCGKPIIQNLKYL